MKLNGNNTNIATLKWRLKVVQNKGTRRTVSLFATAGRRGAGFCESFYSSSGPAQVMMNQSKKGGGKEMEGQERENEGEE